MRIWECTKKIDFVSHSSSSSSSQDWWCAHLWVNKWREVHRIEFSFSSHLCAHFAVGVRVLRYANWFPLLQPKLPNAFAAAPMSRCGPPNPTPGLELWIEPDQTTAMHHEREQRPGGYQGPVLRIRTNRGPAKPPSETGFLIPLLLQGKTPVLLSLKTVINRGSHQVLNIWIRSGQVLHTQIQNRRF